MSHASHWRIASALVIGTGLFVAAVAVVHAGGPGDVLKTKHNLGTPGGNPACSICHTPHDAKGAFLWTKAVGAGAGLAPICYSCHDGSVTTTGGVAFNPTKQQHPVKAGVPGEDCDRCHNSHATTPAYTTLSDLGANSCLSCHGKAGSMNHPIDTVSAASPPIDRLYEASANDFSGTRLYDETGTKVATAGSGFIKCLTCHTAHGAVNKALTTMPMWTNNDASSPLCQNCHQ